MGVELRLPQLGENIKTAEVVRVQVAVGTRVKVDEPILEVEANKASVEVPAVAAGVVDAIHVAAGDEVQVGQLLLTLRDEAAAGTAAMGAPPPPSEAKAEVIPTREPEAPAAGLAVGAPQAEIGVPAPPVAAAPAWARAAPAAPSVRRCARELGLDIADVPGSGPHGRVSIDDVKRHARQRLQQPPAPDPEGLAPATPALPDFAAWGPVRRERMTPIRRATAAQLTRCWSTVAQVTQFDRADVTELDKLQKQYAERATRAGGKLTLAVMVVKVAACALRAFPKFNATIDLEKREVVFKDYVNIGIAVATDRGLLVPVLRAVDSKSMLQIAADVSALAARTRDGSVRLEDLQGGTFTVTNLGNIGGTHFTPIVNWPEVAILGMGRARTEAAFDHGVCQPRLFLPLSLSYDHRLIDGAEGARFLRWVVEAIEQPFLLALEG
jgi:pyruvate dehydrogenase E2 component (dihydrolipoamide acetyltransferase)